MKITTKSDNKQTALDTPIKCHKDANKSHSITVSSNSQQKSLSTSADTIKTDRPSNMPQGGPVAMNERTRELRSAEFNR